MGSYRGQIIIEPYKESISFYSYDEEKDKFNFERSFGYYVNGYEDRDEEMFFEALSEAISYVDLHIELNRMKATMRDQIEREIRDKIAAESSLRDTDDMDMTLKV